MKVLEMNFSSAEGKNVRISVDNPIDPIDAEQVKTAMTAIMEADVFLDSEGNALTEAKSARIVDQTITPIEID
ncbi:DUF2922 domain-containing protein [Lederbergia sp. NSJ-179]|uniref:DUF2922 domain-containing protein n=1 Tax=Lederbergia sp. NSJ-179 TaxID=2931402 RepID=UPI001FD455C8|nr:DUF2922 domain-containing protein [Lederbergia sp. NSJ-179]MCJ7843256.1 DUF2922 domain-containing protein [Lederbergia sp. NSJ-179]